MKQVNGNTFRPEELISMRYYDKKKGQWIETDYPKVGGRLRIAHEQNSSLDITTDIIQYDGSVAVVKALCVTEKGTYSGIGMASVERDAKIAPAILELAETRAIARALRFSGVGVEYCSAEEISHIEQPHSSTPAGKNEHRDVPQNTVIHQPLQQPAEHRPGNGVGRAPLPANGDNGNGRLSQKQHSYLLHLADSRGISRQQLDEMSRERFDCVVGYLSKGDASSLINEMTAN